LIDIASEQELIETDGRSLVRDVLQKLGDDGEVVFEIVDFRPVR
jgi:hypothetical protein